MLQEKEADSWQMIERTPLHVHHAPGLTGVMVTPRGIKKTNLLTRLFSLDASTWDMYQVNCTLPAQVATNFMAIL